MKKLAYSLVAVEVIVIAVLALFDFFGFHNSCPPTNEAILCNPTQVHYARIIIVGIIFLLTLTYAIVLGIRSKAAAK